MRETYTEQVVTPFTDDQKSETDKEQPYQDQVNFDQIELLIQEEDSARQSAAVSEWKAAGMFTREDKSLNSSQIYADPPPFKDKSQRHKQIDSNYNSRRDLTEEEEQMRLNRLKQRKSASRKKWDKPV